MKSEAKHKLVPRLRFPEFKDASGWDIKALQLLAKPVGKQSKGLQSTPVLTLSAENGLVQQGDYFGKKIAGENVERYINVALNDFVYNDRTTKQYMYGAIKRLSKYSSGIVSPIYKCFRFNEAENPIFWEWYFESKTHEPALHNLINEGARAGRFNISVEQFLSITVAKPSHAEQQKIAAFLSSLDDLTRAEGEKLEALREHKKGLMQNLFPAEGETVPKLRFKEFRDAGEWKKREFDEILEITRLAGYEYSEYWEEDPNKEIIALRGYNIGKGKLVLRDLGYISNNLSLQLSRSRLFKGDIVYPCVGTIGNAVVIEEDNKYHIQQNIAKLTPKIGISPYFISQFLMSDLGMKEIYRFNATSSQPNVLVGSLRKFELYIPDFEEQQKIAECLSSLDELIAAQAEKIEELKAHKKGLMQGLFPNINEN